MKAGILRRRDPRENAVFALYQVDTQHPNARRLRSTDAERNLPPGVHLRIRLTDHIR
jgi:hypothetical protein